MAETIEARLIELAKGFATCRRQLRENSKAMEDIRRDQDDYVDMTPMRDRYYGGEWLDEHACIKWHGWLHAVQTLYDYDGEKLDEDHVHYAMAVLLDERKDIKRRANSIKTRLRAIGDQLHKAEQAQ